MSEQPISPDQVKIADAYSPVEIDIKKANHQTITFGRAGDYTMQRISGNGEYSLTEFSLDYSETTKNVTVTNLRNGGYDKQRNWVNKVPMKLYKPNNENENRLGPSDKSSIDITPGSAVIVSVPKAYTEDGYINQLIVNGGNGRVVIMNVETTNVVLEISEFINSVLNFGSIISTNSDADFITDQHTGLTQGQLANYYRSFTYWLSRNQVNVSSIPIQDNYDITDLTIQDKVALLNIFAGRTSGSLSLEEKMNLCVRLKLLPYMSNPNPTWATQAEP